MTNLDHLSHGLGVVGQLDSKFSAVADLLRPRLEADEGDIQRVAGVFDVQGKVTVHIGNGSADDTVVLVALNHIGTRHDIEVIRYGTGNTTLLRTGRSGREAHRAKQNQFEDLIHGASFF